MSALTALGRLHDALATAGSKITNGGSAATCPAHEDHAPSLSIGQRRDRDGVLIQCHAGCQTDDVLAVLGLTPADLFDNPREPGTRPDGRPRTVATYPYTDEDGTLLFEKVRMEPKTFRQRRPEGTGWTWSLGDVPRVLYALPDVLAAVDAGEPVYVAEGEKDADALARAGVTATTWTEGAWKPDQRPKWRPAYTETLRGAHVLIVRDRDETGRHTAATIAALLEPVAASVAVVEPNQGKDAADHLAAGLTVDLLRPVASDEPEPEDEPTHDEPPPLEDDPGADELEERLAFNREVSDELRRLQVREAARDRLTELRAAERPQVQAVDGATFVLSVPEGVPSVWGQGSSVAWAEGEPLTLCGLPGTGKTTLGGQLVRAPSRHR